MAEFSDSNLLYALRDSEREERVAEIERLRERCEAYKGQVEAGAVMIERLTKENAALQSSADDVYARLMPEVEQLRDAVNCAHSEGFEWPADPLATAIYVGPKPASPNDTPDLDKCPVCGGPADNGHDREFPPNPYYCVKCQASVCETGDE